ncbi:MULTISPECIES: hypothetical protein [Bacillus]|uniref:Phr family secreted Rap phosphatase inhibitor n=1 Tax=Bacillus thuringiensis serovar pingluonsis TaxID=180881 RepID=A0A243BH20_BACTU|nr:MULTISPECIES: hypothetical protein [Bacillus]EDX70164.1 hypothetical protein BC059799_1012 [Bacillus cereus NVH0597-99]OTY53026.1 hypothetical protein BK748_19370 [Bacillus thuringiensis serovar graciosensis]AXY08118.1 hypothetical protein CUC43_15420 [Bacillus thuringiensis LM1212]EJQ91960.1 hypothetical protein IGW_03767 [Bacillus cereus ISP3191]MBR9656858.1 hypothetical protein [Bacillus cereus]
MKKMVIKLLGIVTVFTLTLGVYSSTDHQKSPTLMKAEHGDYGG